jgi:arsenate reductase
LTEKGIEFEAVNYLEQPMKTEAIKDLLRRAGLKPQEALRTNDPAYSTLIAGKKLGDDELLRLMAKNPGLIQRPIVVRGSKAVLARPAERLAELGL